MTLKKNDGKARIGLKQKPLFNPLKIAFGVSAIYCLLCGLYIWLSGLIAASIATSVTDLKMIEIFKGLGFIGLTTVVLFFLLWILLERLAFDEKELLIQRNELIQAQKRSIAGTFAASVAHDINNILVILDYYCSKLASSEHARTIDEDIQQKVSSAVGDLKNLSRKLAQIGRKNIPEKFQLLDLPLITKETLNLIRKHHMIAGRSLSYTGSAELNVTGNEFILRQLLINLVLNAAGATKDNGRIEVAVHQEGDKAILEVHDNGPGVPTEKRKGIFEAFYTSKHEGNGLGLLSVKVYTEMHKGTIEILQSHLGGACFRIIFPIQQETYLEKEETIL